MKKNKMKTLLFFILLGCCICANSQPSDRETYIRNHYTKMERYITMRDGVRLFTSIYVPKDQTRKYPLLITRTPYSLSPYGENKFPGGLVPSMLFVKEGYIFVYQDVRGRWMSEGDFVDIRPHNPEKKRKYDTDESSDTYDTVEWLLKNVPSNNGKAGIYGISYPGFYASASLPGAHPAVKAVSPQAPVTDWFIGDDFHHNGAFMMMDAFAFYSSFGMPRPKPITPDQGPAPFHYYTQDNYKFYQDLGPLKNVNKRYLGDSVKFWNDLMAHGTYDDFWKARNIRTHLTNIKPATLVVGGFFDAEDCFGALHTYEALEKQNNGNYNSLVMGPWFHGAWSGGTGGWYGDAAEIFCDIKTDTITSTWYQDNIEFPFFQHFLNDKPDLGIPEATIFETGTNKWRKYDAWPPGNSEKKNLFFHEKGGLSFRAPGNDSAYDEYVSDPSKPVPYDDGIHLQRTQRYMINDQRFASRRPDVVVYQTSELTEDITLAGPVIADLFVSTTGTDADFIVKLIDVYPDDYPNPLTNPNNLQLGGYQMMVRADVMRGKFRNSYEKPEPFTPEMITEVKYNLTDVSHCFRKGHRIMVQVQSSWFPLVDLNPQKFTDIYRADEKDFQKATQRIYHDQKNPSKIIVNVLR
jgi:putative CocE/NonD family hydrolase